MCLQSSAYLSSAAREITTSIQLAYIGHVYEACSQVLSTIFVKNIIVQARMGSEGAVMRKQSGKPLDRSLVTAFPAMCTSLFAQHLNINNTFKNKGKTN